MAKNWLGDMGKTWLNAVATPFEALAGQDFYQPEVEGDFAQGINRGLSGASNVLGAVAPTALNAAMPGLGSVVQAGRGFVPNMEQQPEAYQTQGQAPVGQEPNQTGNALYQFGGQMPQQPQGEQTGPNLFAFNGPSHEEGGINFNGQAEIEKQETIDPSSKYVYSDKLEIEKGVTFAKASEKWKGADTDDDITKKTNKLMLDRLRNNQEEMKKADFDKASKKFEKKYGGYLKEQMKHGGYYTPAEAAADGKQLSQGGVQYGGSSVGGRVQYEFGGTIGEDGSANSASNIAAFENEFGPTADHQAFQNNPEQFMANNPGGYGQSAPGSPQVAQGNQPFDYGNMLNNAGKYANIGYNAYQSQQPTDYYQAQQNPQYDKTIDLMSDRRYDAQPELDEARRTFQQTKGAIQEFAGGNSGVALANTQGAQLRSDRAKQQVYAKKQNMDNQYMAQEAAVRGNMGEQYANELRKTQIYGQQADASRRAFAGQAAADTSKVSQMNQLMGNQQSQDDILATLLNGSYGDLGPMIEALTKAQANTKG